MSQKVSVFMLAKDVEHHLLALPLVTFLILTCNSLKNESPFFFQDSNKPFVRPPVFTFCGGLFECFIVLCCVKSP